MKWFQYFSWITELLTWISGPSVIPWLGAVVAFVSVLFLEPQALLKCPAKSVGRAVLVAALWLIIIWLIGWSAASFGLYGRGGQGNNNAPQKSGAEGSVAPAPAVATVPREFPFEMPEDAAILITFVGSPANPSQSLSYACDLIVKDSQERIEIRAKNMKEFEILLVQQLRNVDLPQPESTIVIRPTPFPGMNVLRLVREKIYSIFPQATVITE